MLIGDCRMRVRVTLYNRADRRVAAAAVLGILFRLRIHTHNATHTHTHCGMSDRLIVYAIKDITRAETEIS